MKLDGAIFSIEQRTVGGCIDLAVVFFREHVWSILQLVACFAVPSVLLSWWLTVHYDWTLSGCLLLFALESPVCGGALVAAAGRRVFGDQFSARLGLQALLGRPLLFFSLTILIRFFMFIAMFIFVFPAYLLATRYGFLSEILFLEGCPAKYYETRLADLMNQTFRNLVGRLVIIMVFYCLTVLSLFVLLDLAAGSLFGIPILAGRVSGLAYMVDEIATLLTRDPRVNTAVISVAWLVYPVARLAWMFCYLDVRIRKEGWDVELDFRVEAQRLEAAA